MGIAIDLVFVVMVFFGFYFGVAFGLVKVVVYVVMLLGALAAAMRFTPSTEAMIREIFATDSVYLPFLSFIITLLALLGLARMTLLLIGSSVDMNRFDLISRVLGGIIMSATFLFLYSVLIAFFVEAKVIDEEKQSRQSYSYKIIRLVPERGKVVLETVAPFIKNFVDYMRHALRAIERRNQPRSTLLDDYYNQALQDSLLQDSLKRKYLEMPPDSFVSSLSTDSVPTVVPEPKEQPGGQ